MRRKEREEGTLEVVETTPDETGWGPGLRQAVREDEKEGSHSRST